MSERRCKELLDLVSGDRHCDWCAWVKRGPKRRRKHTRACKGKAMPGSPYCPRHARKAR